jgi:hypothetical protein
MITKFKIGERVLISPQVTGEKEWIAATIIEIEQNPFVGIVINVKTDDGIIFFEKEDMFKPFNEKELCMQ